MKTDPRRRKAELLLADLMAKRTRGPMDFDQIARSRLAELRAYDISNDDVVRCLNEGLGISSAGEHVIGGGQTLDAIIDAVLAPREPPQCCAATGCGKPSTRVIFGKPCCDDDKHRPEGAPHPFGRRH